MHLRGWASSQWHWRWQAALLAWIHSLGIMRCTFIRRQWWIDGPRSRWWIITAPITLFLKRQRELFPLCRPIETNGRARTSIGFIIVSAVMTTWLRRCWMSYQKLIFWCLKWLRWRAFALAKSYVKDGLMLKLLKLSLWLLIGKLAKISWSGWLARVRHWVVGHISRIL